MEYSDDYIIEQFCNDGSKHQAFSILVNKYQEKLYWHIRRMVLIHEDADDLLQNVFIKVWNNLHKFRGDAQLYTFLYRIATNEVLTFLDKKKKRSGLSVEVSNDKYIDNVKSDHYFDGNEVQKKLLHAINGLPDKQKMVFNMRYYDEMTYEEMSGVMGTSVGALKSSYHHAVKKIQKFFNEH